MGLNLIPQFSEVYFPPKNMLEYLSMAEHFIFPVFGAIYIHWKLAGSKKMFHQKRYLCVGRL